MEDILHSTVDQYLQGFLHPRWCRISSINSIPCLLARSFSGFPVWDMLVLGPSFCWQTNNGKLANSQKHRPGNLVPRNGIAGIISTYIHTLRNPPTPSLSSRIDGLNPIFRIGLYGTYFLRTNLDPFGYSYCNYCNYVGSLREIRYYC